MNRLAVPLAGALFAATAAFAAPSASDRLPPTIANARLAEADLAALAAADDEWLFEEKLACRSSAAKQLWEGTLIDASLGKPARQEFQTIGVGVESDTILYFEFDGDVPMAWRKALNEKLWSASGEPVFSQPELVGQAGGLVVVLSTSLTAKIRRPVGHRLRERFGMRFSDQDPERRKLYDTLIGTLKNREKPAPAGIEFARKNAEALAKLSYGSFLAAELHMALKEHEPAAAAYARAVELDKSGDPLPSDGTVCDALEGIGLAAYHQKDWPRAIEKLRAAADYAKSIARADRQGNALYNLACSAALGGQPDAAMAALTECFGAIGKRMKQQALKDEDLKSLHERPDWQTLMK
jgi:tetratricopeptide (TPR) repeat protein